VHESVLFTCERQRVVCMKRSDLRVIDERINTKTYTLRVICTSCQTTYLLARRSAGKVHSVCIKISINETPTSRPPKKEFGSCQRKKFHRNTV